MTKVGDFLHEFDHNRRVYRSKSSGPVFAEHFGAAKIVRETPKSWVVSCPHGEVTVSKRLMTSNNGRYSASHWYTDEQKRDKIWIHENRHAITSAVSVCDSVEVLQKITALLNGLKE